MQGSKFRELLCNYIIKHKGNSDITTYLVLWHNAISNNQTIALPKQYQTFEQWIENEVTVSQSSNQLTKINQLTIKGDIQ